MEVTVERLHNGRWQVVEWHEDGFLIVWEGTDASYARLRAHQHRLALAAQCSERR